MRSRYFASEALHRIHLAEFDGSDDWVDILDGLTEHDRLAIETAGEQASVQQAVSIDGEPRVFTIKSTAYEREYLAMFGRVIKAWSLINEDNDQPLPLTPAVFRRLGPLGRWLAEQIVAHYKQAQLDEAARKNSMNEPSAPTSTVARSPQSSATSSSPNGSAPSDLTTFPVSASEPSPAFSS